MELFCQAHPETVDIYDISHKAACLLKARLERDEQWKAFAAKAGQTKCNIQQTKWAFLVPPSQRSKARYMNLGPLIAWGVKTLAIIDNPGPEVLGYGTVERLEEKLGWLRQFREPLKGWSEMEQTIDVTVDFVRTEGLYRGAAKDLRKRLGKLSVGQNAAQLGKDLGMCRKQLPCFPEICYQALRSEPNREEGSMDAYAPEIERKMKRLFDSLSEDDRRRYAAVEATKLGHGGIEYIAQLLQCDPKTIRRGLAELDEAADLDTSRVRKKGVDAKS